MVELAQRRFKDEHNFEPLKLSLNNVDDVLWNIGYFGKKAQEFGTIDTYARKLYLNDSYELAELKIAINLFFTIWQLTNDKELKKLKNRKIKEIDSRYISLLSTILEKKDYGIKIKENINFVTWNYDLQLEHAFKKFWHSGIYWRDLHKYLNFSGSDNLQICHLNGYHGFYKTSQEDEIDFLDRTDSKTIDKILEKMVSVYENTYSIDITGHINYAWEESDITKATRKEAMRIFAQTDILIIIGYSFPPFNKDIDSSLFKELEGRDTKIYYQDPQATKEIFNDLFYIRDSKIVCLKDKRDYFHIPYSF